MPIANIEDAKEVERSLHNILSATNNPARIREIRSLFTEILDYYHADSQVSLQNAGNHQLPAEAHIVARRDGVSVVYVSLDNADTNRVTGAIASAAAKELGNVIADNLLLLFANRDKDQLHFINPDLSGSRPKLQRIVAYRDQPQRTTVQQIANMWYSYDRLGKTVREAIAIAFSVEPVTSDFFKAYDALFKKAKEQISGFGDSPTEQEQRHVFTQTLFNRVMFVYFLSRKGWLRFQNSADYLNALWQDYNAGTAYADFYTLRLKPLFFFGLNDPDSRELTGSLKTLIGEVPFLNGGLFEETNLDKREGITVPDALIQQILTDLFDRFNFTVMESTPYDLEVAVDPEMLGKVFEEMVTGRHDSGAYYTPRSVVSFMCCEALKGYLKGKKTGASAEVVDAFVDRHDIQDIGLSQAVQISEALREVTILDPACGSGAYLLGMMQELIELQRTLFDKGLDAKKDYDLKLEIIQRNLYGVDIDDFAVNIAKLRLWLSLAIDYEGDEPQPLPNLDFKVLCGDSLLGPDPSVGVEVQGTLGQDTEQFRLLGDLKGQYMRESLVSKKEQLRIQIREREVAIRESLGAGGALDRVIDWRVEFAEVFAETKGFDVAIANPPYIQLQNNGGHLAKLYKDTGYQTLERGGDIYQLFYERGCQLLKQSKGILVYITSNSWLKTEYGRTTRRYFAENHTPLSLLELGKDVFDAAIVDSGVFVLSTGGESRTFPGVDMDQLDSKEVPPVDDVWGRVEPEKELPWSILVGPESGVWRKMCLSGIPLRDLGLKIYRGVTTGLNDAFVVDSLVKAKIVNSDPASAELMKPVLRGENIHRFRTKWDGEWLITTLPSKKVDIDCYPGIRDHLLSFGKDRLEQSGKPLGGGTKSRKKTGNKWFETQDATKYYEEFLREKLFWMDMAGNGRVAYSETEIYCTNKGYVITGQSLKYLCAILNSSLVTWFMKHNAPTTGMGLTEWTKVAVERIPIPSTSGAQQRPLVHLVDHILDAKDADPNADTIVWEREIDQLVYTLYAMTDEEITAIERSLGLIHATDEEEDAALLKILEDSQTEERVSREEVMQILESQDAG